MHDYLYARIRRPWLWDYSARLMGRWGKADNEYWVSLTFLGINVLFENAVHLPFSLYSQFVVEAKHGFNKQTITDFMFGTCARWLKTML